MFAAIKSAKGGPVEEGSVGAGTGTVAFGFKGGIGTSSRRLPPKLGGYTVGVLVQTNSEVCSPSQVLPSVGNWAATTCEGLQEEGAARRSGKTGR